MRTHLLHCGTQTWRCHLTERISERMRGLLGRSGLPPGELLSIPHCNLIHTFGMRFPIDVIFIDANGTFVKIVRNLHPKRFAWGGRIARQTLEAQSGWLPNPLPSNTVTFEQPNTSAGCD